MTQMTGPELNKGSCVAALTQPAPQVHLAGLAAFAQTGCTITVHTDRDQARGAVIPHCQRGLALPARGIRSLIRIERAPR